MRMPGGEQGTDTLSGERGCSGAHCTLLSAQGRSLRQAFVEEEQEWQEGVDTSRYRRSTRISASVRPERAAAPEISLPAALQCYCLCLQRLLQVHPRVQLPKRVSRVEHACALRSPL